MNDLNSRIYPNYIIYKASFSHMEASKVLLDSGANEDIKDKLGETALKRGWFKFNLENIN